MNNPEFVKIKGKLYKINTDFRIAIECNEIAEDLSISDEERSLAIIYKLFGDEGLNHHEDYNELLKKALFYLKCGVENSNTDDEKDMDYKQDFRLIQASFKSDYGIELNDKKMHWWEFYMYLNGLTDACVLNRVRDLRNYDLSEVKNPKEKQKIQKLQNQFKLKKQEKKFTEEQMNNINNFYKKLGIEKGV